MEDRASHPEVDVIIGSKNIDVYIGNVVRVLKIKGACILAATPKNQGTMFKVYSILKMFGVKEIEKERVEYETDMMDYFGKRIKALAIKLALAQKNS